MPKNRIHKTKDGRYEYKFTDSTGKRKSLRSRKSETLKMFKLRCEENERKDNSPKNEITFAEAFELYKNTQLKTLTLGG